MPCRRELGSDGLVRRYDTGDAADGVAGDEGAFLACSFWLADALVPRRAAEAGRARFEGLLGLCNDVGLLAEEYDVEAGRQLGNVPQAYSHLALVNTALNLAEVPSPTDRSPGRGARRGLLTGPGRQAVRRPIQTTSASSRRRSEARAGPEPPGPPVAPGSPRRARRSTRRPRRR